MVFGIKLYSDETPTKGKRGLITMMTKHSMPLSLSWEASRVVVVS